MGIWGLYQSRIEARGSSMREAALQREARMLNSKMKDSLSYHNVVIDGVPRNVSIINSDNYNEKTMFSLPGEDIRCGALVEWADNFWLVTEKDANTELYTRVKLLQCNYLLKWVDDNNIIREQWCVIEDGTKLEHIYYMCNSLACWKRHVKTTSLIAGTPLEPYSPQRNFEIKVGVMV